MSENPAPGVTPAVQSPPMNGSGQGVEPVVSSGRCPTCRHSQTIELPTRTLHFCRALRKEMEPSERDAVRDCVSWEPYRPVTLRSRRRLTETSGIARELMAVEDRLFGALSRELAHVGCDLRTVMMLAHPSIDDVRQLDWLDEADTDEGDERLPELVARLRDLRYDALADFITPLLYRHHDTREERSDAD